MTTANALPAAKPPKRQKRRRLLRGMLFILGIFLLGFIIIQCFIYFYTKPNLTTVEAAPEADAVLVLGARVYANGQPSATLRDRLDVGYELYAAGKVKKILVSGDHGQTTYDEVNVMKDYLLAKGVPRSDIFLDHAGFDTYDSLYRARDIFCVESLLISTQSFHMPRALYIGKRLGLEVAGVPSPNRQQRWLYNQCRESLARVKAVWDVEVLQRQPRYLGEAIPIMGDGIITEG